MGPIWGALGDRFGRRLMVLRAMGAIALFVGLMAFARSPWELLALRLAQGLFSGFLAPSLTLVSIATPPESQGRVAGSLNTSMVWGAILGPLLGELVRAELGIREVYLAVSALSLVGLTLVRAFAAEDRSTRRESSGGVRPLALLRESFGDLGELRQSRNLRAAVALLFVVQFGMGATNPQLELYVRELPSQLTSLAPSTAVLFSLMAFANLVAMPLWGRFGDDRGAYRALRLCAVWSGLALLVHALVPGYEVLLLARILLGGGSAGSGPLAFGVAAAETRIDRRGGAFGVVFSARALAVSSSAMLGGLVVAAVGLRGLFAVGGALVLLVLVLAGGDEPARRAPDATGDAGEGPDEFFPIRPQRVGGDS
jgi:MFS family permease